VHYQVEELRATYQQQSTVACQGYDPFELTLHLPIVLADLHFEREETSPKCFLSILLPIAPVSQELRKCCQKCWYSSRWFRWSWIENHCAKVPNWRLKTGPPYKSVDSDSCLVLDSSLVSKRAIHPMKSLLASRDRQLGDLQKLEIFRGAVS